MGVCLGTTNQPRKEQQQDDIQTLQINQIDKQLGQLEESILDYNKLPPNKKQLGQFDTIKKYTQEQNDQAVKQQNCEVEIQQSNVKVFLQHKVKQRPLIPKEMHSTQKIIEQKRQRKSVLTLLEQASTIKRNPLRLKRSFSSRKQFDRGLTSHDNQLISSTLHLNTNIMLQQVSLTCGIKYTGQWLRGMRHGIGVQMWKDGTVIEGNWQLDYISGQANIKFRQGHTYQGSWKEDLFHGIGKFHMKNGSIYQGEWVYGRKQGKGKQYWDDGQIYEGQFHNGFKHGNGIIKFKDTSYYQGQFNLNQIHGTGKYIWANSRQYQGQWEKNKIFGEGKMIWKDGRVYEGSFRDDKPDGKGTMIKPNGSKYQGHWINGKEDGVGQYFQNQRFLYAGQWKAGKLLSKRRQARF